jgi:hypothetical protein
MIIITQNIVQKMGGEGGRGWLFIFTKEYGSSILPTDARSKIIYVITMK